MIKKICQKCKESFHAPEYFTYTTKLCDFCYVKKMEGNNIKWTKCPSVMTGGKDYFYVTFAEIDGKRHKFSVVWQKDVELFGVLQDDCLFGLRKSSRSGMNLVEKFLRTGKV